MGCGHAGRKLNRHRGRGSGGGEALASQSNNNTGATPTTKQNEFSKCIYDRLVRLNIIGCSSTHEEYDSISATIAYSLFPISDDAGPTNDGSSNDSCSIGDPAPYPSNEEIDVAARTLVEYFDELSFKDAEELIRDAALDAWDKKKNVGQSSCNLNNINTNDEIHDEDEDDDRDYDDDDDGEYIGEGECELCERSVKLTRHHLVPKSTWPKMKKRLWSAASIIEELEQHSLQLRDVSYYAQGLDDVDKEKREEERLLLRKQLDKILGDRFDITYLPTTITNDTIRNYLARVCHLCRQCHSAVHRIHSSEWELATEYNTMERLLECKEILKYGAWASKQRCGRLAK